MIELVIYFWGMKTLQTIKVNDFITIGDVDLLVNNALKTTSDTLLAVNRIRFLCSLKNDKKYKVVDVCRSCKLVYIKYGKNKAWIKYKYINAIF